MFVAFAAVLGLRGKTAHTAPSGPPPAAPGSPVAVASGSAAASAAAAVTDAGADAAAAAVTDAGADAGAPKQLMDRPLRLAAMGWDLLAPALLENDGLNPGDKSGFKAAGLDLRLAALSDMAGIEKALARGGADDSGADVAIVPLPALVASYERLRALSPEVFLVVGFSRGREVLASKKDALPEKGEIKLAGVAGDPSAFLALFAMDAAGVPPAEVRLVAPSEAESAGLAAVSRGAVPQTMKPLLTSADAPRLIPHVAIAPHGFIDGRRDLLVALARGWLAGTRKLAADLPAGARRVASAAGASDPLAFVERLGELGSASLTDNARMAGLSGRDPLTLDALFQRSWAVWRGVGALATPAPERAPVTTEVIAALALAEGGAKDPEPAGKAPDGWEKAKPMLVHRQEKLDEAALVAAAGQLAAAFDRAVVRIGVLRGPAVDAAKTKQVVDAVVGRFGLPPGRVVAATKAGGKGAAVIEVLGAP